MEAIAAIAHRFVTIILAIFTLFTGVASPSTDDVIKAINKDNVKLTFTAIGDPQVNSFTGNEKDFIATLKDMSNAETRQDAFVIAGDITENCFNDEWNTVYDNLEKYDVADNYVFATGNHDVRVRNHKDVVDTFTSYYNDFTDSNITDLHYSMEVNGYTFVVVGTEKTELEKAYLSQEQLDWIDATVKKATDLGKPCFVICHQPLKNTHGLPDIWKDGLSNGQGQSGHVGDQSDALYNILNKYDNVILISGHLHTGFGQYTYEKVGNINSVNLPAVGKTNEDGTYDEFSIGYTVEVYKKEILFRARDFGAGKYVSQYDITIPLV